MEIVRNDLKVLADLLKELKYDISDYEYKDIIKEKTGHFNNIYNFGKLLVIEKDKHEITSLVTIYDYKMPVDRDIEDKTYVNLGFYFQLIINNIPFEVKTEIKEFDLKNLGETILNLEKEVMRVMVKMLKLRDKQK